MSISPLVALGVRADGQKVLLAVKNMRGESEAVWRVLLDDLVKRSLPTPELVIVGGAPELEKALAALWSNVSVQRCVVRKHRNQLAHAPECQSASKIDPRSAFKIDPCLVVARNGSARPGEAGRGCAAGAGAGRFAV